MVNHICGTKRQLKHYCFLLSLYTVYASPKTATQVVIIEQITSTTTVVPYPPISPQMKILYNKFKYLYTENKKWM